MKLKFNENYTSRFKRPTETVFRPTKNNEKFSSETDEKSIKYSRIAKWLLDSGKQDKECREVTTNVNNSSKTGQTGSESTGSSDTSTFSTNTKQTSGEESSATNENEKRQTTKIAAIFVAASRNVQHVSSDVVRAHCMNHGYKIEKTVGEGAYAKVKLADVLPSKMARNADLADNADNEGNLQVAIKVIDGKNVPREFLKKFLPRELENHVPLPPHKHVVRVFEQFKSGDRFYVVMEFCSRGDLLDLINQRISESKKGLGEDRARNLFRMLAEGIHHIHTHGIVHRDLKCENVLLDKDENIKITDFGFSTKFKPGISSLLKTSCGSYAYTAPEVIKVRPYDGTKSDIWSMGIILFAMLNGRLPFNDAQLSELEEDMKMQRLRFERTVSFESMVLVRRMLQYNPSSRPPLAEILNDPWLTGRRAIPRQPLKPKWSNPYQKSTSKNGFMVCQPEGKVAPSDGAAVYYKGTVTERGSEATVTVSHNKNETVVLKSRKGSSKKNIWISGPPAAQRPNTWPRSDKIWKSPSKPGSQTRRSSASCQNNTAIGAKQRTNKPGTGKNVNNVRLSKELIEKFIAEQLVNIKPPETCVCCKAEAESVCLKTRLGAEKGEDVDFRVLDNGDVIKTAVPEKSLSAGDKKYTIKAVSAKDTRTSGRVISSEVSKRLSASPHRKSVSSDARSVRASAVSPMKIAVQSPTSPDQGQGQTQSWVNYMVNPTTSPAERVKYFRDRLMKLYGNDERPEAPNNGASGLPPLLVQSLTTTVRSVDASTPASPQPPSQPKTSQKTAQSPTRCSAGTRRPSAPASTWRSARSLSTSGKPKLPVKPVQRVVVHSAVV